MLSQPPPKTHRRRNAAVLLVAVALVGGIGSYYLFQLSPPPPPSLTVGKRLGFWLTDHEVRQVYDPATFFNAYFLREPYPASLEMIIDSAAHTRDSQAYFEQVASLADAYPNIEMAFMLAFDMSVEAEWTVFESFVEAVRNHPSAAMIGVDGEHVVNNSLTNMERARSIVEARGKRFVSYFVREGFGPQYLEIGHTNFPRWNDHEATLDWFNTYPPYIGISSGGYASITFPETRILPDDPTTRIDYGWSREVVDTVLAHAVSKDDVVRHAVNLCPGFSLQSFVGVSGRITRQLWDNPLLRSWIWENPDYPANFILSTA